MTTSADTKDAGHTPTPWADSMDGLAGANGELVQVARLRVGHVSAHEHPEAVANTAFILTAVNSHAELLEALKGIRELVRLTDLSEPEQCAAALNDIDAIAAHQIRAAISRAEGR